MGSTCRDSSSRVYSWSSSTRNTSWWTLVSTSVDEMVEPNGPSTRAETAMPAVWSIISTAKMPVPEDIWVDISRVSPGSRVSLPTTRSSKTTWLAKMDRPMPAATRVAIARSIRAGRCMAGGGWVAN